MEQLSLTLLRNELSKEVVCEYHEGFPEKVIQFGEGNFLRGFVDWMIHELNKQGLFNGKVVAIQPTPHGKVVPKLNRQDGLYTLALRGVLEGQLIDRVEIISSISRGINPYEDWQAVLRLTESPDIKFMFSNTTEAGLSYMQEDYDPNKAPLSFPGKVTAFLYHRYRFFNGAPDSGLIIIPCELVENNGLILKELVLKIAEDWQLPDKFKRWVEQHNRFCNTLVDRIVPGYPKEDIETYTARLHYKDELLTVAEPYHLFVIDADQKVADMIPFHKAGLNVKWGDVTPYRNLKVGLLNAPHTMMFAASYLSGHDTVSETMDDQCLFSFILQAINEELLPYIECDEVEKKQFIQSVLERFRNPYNKHFLTDIGLNAVYKFRTRIIPLLEKFVKHSGRLPRAMLFSLAALIAYYRAEKQEGDFLIGNRDGETYLIRDNKEVIDVFYKQWSNYNHTDAGLETLVTNVLGDQRLWGQNLNLIPQLNVKVHQYLSSIVTKGMEQSITEFLDSRGERQ